MTATPKTLEERSAAAPTDLHKRFAEWIEMETGVKPDLKSVQLACIFRMEFQASPENQKALKDRKAANAKKAADAKKAKIAAAKKLLAELEAETAVETPAEAPAPVAKKAVAKPATPTPAARERKTAAQRRAVATRKTTTPDVPEDFDRNDDNEPVKPARRRRAAAPKTAPVAK